VCVFPGCAGDEVDVSYCKGGMTCEKKGALSDRALWHRLLVERSAARLISAVLLDAALIDAGMQVAMQLRVRSGHMHLSRALWNIPLVCGHALGPAMGFAVTMVCKCIRDVHTDNHTQVNMSEIL
jgi:hypothetical protein